MTGHESTGPQAIVLAAVEPAEILSAALFVAGTGSRTVELVAAAGIEGAPLHALAVAVRDPTHPIPRTLIEGLPVFDVRPTRPGGPALRSHLPLKRWVDGGSTPIGVLAVAHEGPLSPETRQKLGALADRAAASLGPIEERRSSPSD